MAYNKRKHLTTGVTLYSLMYGRERRTSLDAEHGLNTVDILGQQDGICFDLSRTQNCACVGGEIGIARAAAKNDNSSFFQMANSLASDIGFCNRIHGDRGLYPDRNVTLLETISHGQCIDDSGQHAHMVCTCTLHTVAAVFQSAPEVTAADDDTNLHTQSHTLFDHITDLAYDFKVKTALLTARESLAGDLQKYSFIFRFVQFNLLPLSLAVIYFI